MQTERMIIRENRMFHGATVVELDEEVDGVLFDLKENDDGEIDNGDFEVAELQSCRILCHLKCM